MQCSSLCLIDSSPICSEGSLLYFLQAFAQIHLIIKASSDWLCKVENLALPLGSFSLSPSPYFFSPGDIMPPYLLCTYLCVSVVTALTPH